jgi:hypothetical protein
VACLCCAPAFGATRIATLSGQGLRLADVCAAQVAIEPAPALAGRVVVEASFDDPREYDRLRLGEDGTITISGRDPACAPRAEGPPARRWPAHAAAGPEVTLRLRILVPYRFPLALHGSLTGSCTIGEVDGPLQAVLMGTADLRASAIDGLDVRLEGAGRMVVDRVEGTTSIHVTSGGNVDILSGAITTLTVAVEGAGQVRVAAPSDEADLAVTGAGEISVAPVAGPLRRAVHGSGSIEVVGR